jgi:plastocyanin
MTWGLLLRVAGAKTALLMVVVGIALRDKEAVAIGLGLGVGLGLLSFRSGLLGRVVLLLLGLDVLAWMAAAAIANVADGEDVIAVVVPLALSVGAAVTLLAAMIDLIRSRGRSMGGPKAVTSVAVASILVFMAGLVVAAVGGGAPVRAQAGDIRVPMKNARFKVERITAPSGRVTVVVKNEDLFWHTFTIDALHVDSRVPVHASRRVTFAAEPGTYTYYCAIPGHRSIGMEGKLVVQ